MTRQKRMERKRKFQTYKQWNMVHLDVKRVLMDYTNGYRRCELDTASESSGPYHTPISPESSPDPQTIAFLDMNSKSDNIKYL